MDEQDTVTYTRYREAFKAEFTEEQLKILISGLIDYVPEEYLALLANVHGFGTYSFRDALNCYLQELISRDKSTCLKEN